MKNMIIYYIIGTSYLFSHCQVPCGIYDDARKVIEIEENIKTINKAMNNILTITSNNEQTAHKMNQLVRWINTKEQHAQQIQNTLMEYFLAQRIKPKKSSDDGYSQYVNLTTLCQNIIFIAMKTKQTVDLLYLEELSTLLDKLEKIYFDDHGIKHLKQLREN